MPKNIHNVAKMPTIERLPAYLRELQILNERNTSTVSTTHLSQVLQLLPIVVRKDLSITGIVGKPRIGYNVKELIEAIECFLGWDKTNDAVLIGVGHLGTALMGYARFLLYGLRIAAAFDNSPAIVGKEIHGKKVRSFEELPQFLKERPSIKMAILTVPSEPAQGIADLLVENGIQGIWNFTSLKLNLPDDVATYREDLASGLAVLSIQLKSIIESEGEDE